MRNVFVVVLLIVGSTAGCADMVDPSELTDGDPAEPVTGEMPVVQVADELPVEPIACISTSECVANGCCGFAEGGDVPRCVESPSSTCDVPGTVIFSEVDGNVASVTNGSSTLKDTCYCSAGTYRVRWCYSAVYQYWYTHGNC